jgi:hypothetical protein
MRSFIHYVAHRTARIVTFMSILALLLAGCGRHVFRPVIITPAPTSSGNNVPPPTTSGPCAAPNDTPATYFGVDINLQTIGGARNLPTVLQDIQQLGAGWVRIGFPWSVIEPAPGVYHWTQVDRLVALIAGQYHLHILAELDTVPTWAAVGGQVNKYGNGVVANPQDFGQFAAAVAQHFAGQVCAFKIFNEPYNSGMYWPNGTPHQYAATLAAAYVAIHQAEPDDLVLDGGIGCVSNPTNRSNGIVQNQWFYQLVNDPQYPLGKYVDVLSYHFDALGEAYAADKVNCTRAALAKTGYNRPGWADEWSYPSDPQAQAFDAIPGYEDGEQSQAAYVALWARQILSLPGMEKEFYLSLNDLSGAPQFRSVGLIDNSGQPKPAFTALQQVWKSYGS